MTFLGQTTGTLKACNFYFQFPFQKVRADSSINSSDPAHPLFHTIRNMGKFRTCKPHLTLPCSLSKVNMCFAAEAPWPGRLNPWHLFVPEGPPPPHLPHVFPVVSVQFSFIIHTAGIFWPVPGCLVGSPGTCNCFQKREVIHKSAYIDIYAINRYILYL